MEAASMSVMSTLNEMEVEQLLATAPPVAVNFSLMQTPPEG